MHESPTRAEPSAIAHGLYWLCADLAERAPLVLVIDDVHWADGDSLRWLGYLSRRVDDLAVLALLAQRTGDDAADGPALAALADEAVERLTLQPLSAAATARLVGQALDRAADIEFCRACYTATGGNPFYLRELLTMVRDERLEPTADNAVDVPRLAPPSVARAILLRIVRLGDDAVRLARAVAVLGPDVELRHAAAVAELDDEASQVAADTLAAARHARKVASPVRRPNEALDVIEVALVERPQALAAALGLQPRRSTEWGTVLVVRLQRWDGSLLEVALWLRN
jgi:predicted ATPase